MGFCFFVPFEGSELVGQEREVRVPLRLGSSLCLRLPGQAIPWREGLQVRAISERGFGLVGQPEFC